MQEYLVQSYRNLCAAIILQACKDYKKKNDSICKPERYFRSQEYEFHSSFIDLKVSGEELMRRLDSGNINVEMLAP